MHSSDMASRHIFTAGFTHLCNQHMYNLMYIMLFQSPASVIASIVGELPDRHDPIMAVYADVLTVCSFLSAIGSTQLCGAASCVH